MPEDTIYELKDVQVDTLGLVERGANQEEFFLLKTEDVTIEADTVDTNKVQEQNQSEMEEKVTKSVWQKLIELFKKSVADPSIITIETSNEELNKEEAILINDPVVAEKQLQEESNKEEIMPDNIETEKIEEVITETIEETEKGEPEMPTTEEMISKADFEKAQVRISELENTLEAVRVEKEQMTWLNKAAEFGYAPVSTKELGDHFYTLAKYDMKEVDWLVDLLKSYDAMLADSGMYQEKGTSLVQEDALANALSSENPREALLSIPRKDQEAYIRRMRVESK